MTTPRIGSGSITGRPVTRLDWPEAVSLTGSQTLASGLQHKAAATEGAGSHAEELRRDALDLKHLTVAYMTIRTHRLSGPPPLSV